jgi:hypothetical protein
MAEEHCHTNSQDLISEKLCGEKDVDPTCGFMASPEVRSGTPAYMLRAKTKGKACTHMLPRATTALKPTSRLREGTSATMCP